MLGMILTAAVYGGPMAFTGLVAYVVCRRRV
jgi:hypothetical protein